MERMTGRKIAELARTEGLHSNMNVSLIEGSLERYSVGILCSYTKGEAYGKMTPEEEEHVTGFVKHELQHLQIDPSPPGVLNPFSTGAYGATFKHGGDAFLAFAGTNRPTSVTRGAMSWLILNRLFGSWPEPFHDYSAGRGFVRQSAQLAHPFTCPADGP